MCCITLFFGNWSMLGWFRVLWHSWLPAGKNKNAFKILQKSNSYTIVIFRFHISQNMKVETIWFPSDFCCTMYKQSYEIKSPPWTILWFRILGIFSVENIARLGVLCFKLQTIVSSALIHSTLLSSWLLSEVWSIKPPNLSIFSAGKGSSI
jgi:hypothetical protein